MELYVANCSKQPHDFIYRVPESKERGVRHQNIRPGEQIRVYQDTSRPIIDAILDQHTRYGLVPAKQVDRTKAFVGLCYSIDDPVDVEAIMLASERNDNVLMDDALERRKEIAAATNARLDEAVGDQRSGLAGLDIEVVEQTKAGERGMNERITVEQAPESSARRRAKRE